MINNKLIFIIIFPAMKLKGNAATKKLKRLFLFRLDFLNKKRVYSEEPLLPLSPDFKQSFQMITSSFIYPIKDYKIELMSVILENLSAFVRKL